MAEKDMVAVRAAKAAKKQMDDLVQYVPETIPNKEQYIQLINQQVLGKAKDGSNRPLSDLIYFLQVCQRTQLDPFMKQIYGVYRWNSRAGKEVLVIQTGIDGLRSVAERSKLYAGSDAGVFDYPEPPVPPKNYPARASVTVYKLNHITGERMPTTATAQWAEYYPGDGADGNMWRKLPETMLEKCAEAKALRKAFPATAQLYVAEEMNAQESPVAPGVPALGDEIANAGTVEQLSEIMQKLSTEDRKRAVPLIAARMEELAK